MKRLFLSALVVLLLGAAPSFAEPMQDALAAYFKGDYATAMRLWKPLAEQGDFHAQTELGMLYEEGKGVLQDYLEAVRWYRLAAERGDYFGQIFLGSMYEFGQGVPKDYVQAHMWYNLAAAQGGITSDAFKKRSLLAYKMTPEQITEAQRLAREWKPKQ